MPETKDKPLNFPCTFTKISGGRDASGVGVTIASSRIPDRVALQTFRHKRVHLHLRTTPNGGEDAAQTHAPQDAFTEVDAAVDVKGVRFNKEEVKFRLNFDDDVPRHDVLDIAERNGMLTVLSVDEIPENEDTEENAPAERNGLPPANTTGKDDGASQHIEALVDFGFPKRLVESLVGVLSGPKIASLEIRMKLKPSTWMKDIPGIGGKSQELLLDAYEQFRRKFPMPEKTLFEG